MAFGPKTKTAEQRMVRRQHIAELYLESLSMAEIGRHVGVSATQVYRDICWAREQWRTRAADAIERHKQRELARIDVVELEAWRAWERSIGLHVVTTTKTTTVTTDTEKKVDVDLPATEETRKSELLAGDPRFLEVIAKCIEARRKILGLDAPTRREFGGPNGEQLEPVHVTVTFVAPPEVTT